MVFLSVGVDYEYTPFFLLEQGLRASESTGRKDGETWCCWGVQKRPAVCERQDYPKSGAERWDAAGNAACIRL